MNVCSLLGELGLRPRALAFPSRRMQGWEAGWQQGTAAGRGEGEPAGLDSSSLGGRWGQRVSAVFRLAGRAFQVAFGLSSCLIFMDFDCTGQPMLSPAYRRPNHSSVPALPYYTLSPHSGACLCSPSSTGSGEPGSSPCSVVLQGV